MAQEAIAFAAPRTEDLTKVAAGGAGAVATGLVQGVVVKMAPQMGAAAPILTWGSILGTPIVGVMGALVTRGVLGDFFQGIAAGSLGILGYTIPSLILPAVERRRREIEGGGGIKQLGAGNAAQRAQEAAKRAGIKSVVEI